MDKDASRAPAASWQSRGKAREAVPEIVCRPRKAPKGRVRFRRGALSIGRLYERTLAVTWGSRTPGGLPAAFIVLASVSFSCRRRAVLGRDVQPQSDPPIAMRGSLQPEALTSTGSVACRYQTDRPAPALSALIHRASDGSCWDRRWTTSSCPRKSSSTERNTSLAMRRERLRAGASGVYMRQGAAESAPQSDTPGWHPRRRSRTGRVREGFGVPMSPRIRRMTT